MDLRIPAEKETLDLQDEARVRELARQLRRFLEWMNHPEPEDAAQEALLRGIKRMRQDQVQGSIPVAFFFGIGRHLVQEGWRVRNRTVLELEVFEATHPVHWDKMAEDQLWLEELLNTVPEADRDLFQRYHQEDRKTLCQRLGISIQTLRVRVHRIRTSLELAAGSRKFRGEGMK